jgi:hypothetical protein
MVSIRMQPIILLLIRIFFKDLSKMKRMVFAYLKCIVILEKQKTTKQKINIMDDIKFLPGQISG